MDMTNVAEKTVAHNQILQFREEFGGARIPAGLLSLHRWGELGHKHIAQATGFSYDYVAKTLAGDLTRDGLISRVRVIRTRFSPGRLPYLYALTANGHKALCEEIESHWDVGPVGSARRTAGDMIGEHRPPTKKIEWNPGYPHKSDVAHCLIAAENAARRLPHGTDPIGIVSESRRWNGISQPTRIHLPDSKGGGSIKSDLVVALSCGVVSWALLTEVDRHTEALSPREAKNLHRTIEGKIKRYWALIGDPAVEEHYGVTCRAFQVLFLTKTKTRADNIANLVETCGLMPVDGLRPRDVFRFSTLDEAKSDFFGGHWSRTDGTKLALVDKSEAQGEAA